MASAVTDLLDRVTDSTTGRPVISALAAPGKALAAPSINLSDVTNWTTATGIHLSIYNTVSVAGVAVKDPTTQTDWKGTLAGTTISGLTLTGGTDRTYTAGAIVEITPTARYAKDIYEWGIAHANQDGTLKATAIQAALGLGSDALNGWNPLGQTFNTVTYNGNRSYTGVINSVDVTGTLSVGSKLKVVKTVSAPTQCLSVNGTTQYLTKSSPAGMTQTDDISVFGWVKVSTMGATQVIMGRYNGTNGWAFFLDANNRLSLAGQTVGDDAPTSYRSLPLNKWVHVVATLDSSGAASTMYFDGESVPVTYTNNANTGITQGTGALQVGAMNGAYFFNGRLGMVGYASKVLSASEAKAIYSQALTASDIATYSVVSAFTLSGASGMTDINTTNANNLTAAGSATTTNADAPYGLDASDVPSATVAFGEITSLSFSTNTTVNFRVPEGCTVPTSGGITTVYYSGQTQPFGFRQIGNELGSVLVGASQTTAGTADLNGWTTTVTVPTGVTSLETNIVMNATPAASNTQFWVLLYEGSTIVRSWFSHSANGTNLFSYMYYGKFQVTPGSHTYKLTLNPTGSNITTASPNNAAYNEMVFKKL